MEVEVKLRLPNAAAHSQLTTLLSPFHCRTEIQENFFFDGASKELSSRRAVLRLRFSANNTRCVVAFKANAVLVNGVSRVEEDEEELDPIKCRACVEDPSKLKEIDCRVLRRVKEEIVGDKELRFVGLGGFENVRHVYKWKELKLEVDETKYQFGTCYEIECESADPENAKRMLEELLKENGIEYSYSQASKFAVFRSGKLP